MPEDVLPEIISILSPEQKLFVQVVQTDYAGIMDEARKISAMRPENMYVKIPVSRDGLKAIKQCRKEGIKTLATAIYTPPRDSSPPRTEPTTWHPTPTACATTETVSPKC